MRYTSILLAFVFLVTNAFASYPGETPSYTTIKGGNLKLQTNTLSSENTNGNISLSPNGTGLVEVNSAFKVLSTTKGAQPCPVMTEVQRDAISSPADGDCVYNSTSKKVNTYNGSAWIAVETGDLDGPASATDNAITRFDGTTGKLVQNSSASVADDGAITAKSVTATNAADTSTFHGMQLNNAQITAVTGSNLTLSAADAGANVQVAKNIVHQKNVLHTTSTDAATGTGVTLTAPTTKYVRLTAAGTLVSINMIPAGLSGQELVLYNATGATVSVNNDTGATAADRIYTGTGAAFSLSDKASLSLAYDTTTQRWQVTGGAGGVNTKAENGTSVVASELQFANNQITSTATGKYRVESGNGNLLSNPSFEATIGSTGWTVDGTGSNATDSTTYVVDGKKGLCFFNVADNFGIYQDSTLYASQFADGTVQGETSFRLKTDHDAAITACPRKAGSTLTNPCVTITAAENGNKWALYKIPFVFGGTSNGVSIVGAAGSGNVCIDDVELKATKENDQSPVLTAPQTCTVTGSWSSNTTYTCKKWQSGPYVNYEINLALSGAPTAATLTVNLPSGDVIDTSAYPVAPTAGLESLGDADLFDSSVSKYNGRVIYNDTTSVQVRYYIDDVGTSGASVATGTVNATAPETWASGDKIKLSFKVPIVGLASSVNTYTDQCQNDITCTNEFSASISNTGVVSEEGQDWINGDCAVSGTSIYTCTLVSNVFGANPHCTIASATNEVKWNTQSTTTVEYQTFSNSAATATNAKLVCKRSTDYKARRQVVGQFKDIPTTLGSSGSDMQSVYFGGNASCSTACSTGSCTICARTGTKITSVDYASSTGLYNVQGIDGTKYNCTGNGYGSAPVLGMHERPASSSTMARMNFYTASTGAVGNAAYATIVCIGVP